MNKLWNIAKAGAVMFAVGALLALCAPLVAGAVGETMLGSVAYSSAMATPVLWTAAFFGTFGALHATIAPVFDKIDGTSRKAEIAQARLEAHLNEPDKPCCGKAMEAEKEVVADYFRAQEEQRRGTAAAGIHIA